MQETQTTSLEKHKKNNRQYTLFKPSTEKV